MIVVENPGKDKLTITIKDGEKLGHHSSTDRVGQGGGVKASTTYRFPDGDSVHVGSEPAERKVIVRA